MQSLPHELSFSRRPLCLLAAAFASGILVAHYASPPLALLLICSSLAFVLALISFLKNYPRLSIFFLTTAFVAIGASLHVLEQSTTHQDSLKQLLEQKAITGDEPVELTGVLKRAPEGAPQGLYLTLKVQRVNVRNKEIDASGVVLLLAPISTIELSREYEELELRYGARLRVMTALQREDAFRNPGVSSFTDYLEQKGLSATAVIKSPLLVERLDDERVFLPLAWLYNWRRSLEKQLHALLSQETAGVLDAALLGNRNYLSRSTAERFREGGTFHVLVISGLHISFIGGIVFLLARRFTDRRGLQFVLSGLVLWSYAIAVGAETSVVRAALMFTIVAFAPVVARHNESLNALGAAAIVLLTFDPADLFNASFQLTFLSVLAITAFAWPLLQGMSEIGSWRPTRNTPCPPDCAHWLRSLCELLFWSERQWEREMGEQNYNYRLFKSPFARTLENYRLQRFARYAFGAMVVSGSVQLLLLPLLVVYFHRVSLASLLLNIGVGAGMAGLAALALATVMFAQVNSMMAIMFAAMADLVAFLTIHAVDLFNAIGIGAIRVPEYSGWKASVYLIYYLPLGFLTYLLSRWKPLESAARPSLYRFAWMAQCLFLIIVLLHPFSAAPADGTLRFDFLDVGQGDSIFITMPDGTKLLVDGGGRPDFLMSKDDERPQPDRRSIGEAVVSEFLWYRGLDTVDYILATHAHADHIDGLSDVARNFYVKGVLLGRTPDGDPEYADFSAVVDARKLPLVTIQTGDVIRFGAARVEVLWPPALYVSESFSPNDDSVVLRISLGAHSVLLTGDIESRAEAALIARNASLHSDVVKVPHHGSRSSSTGSFVKATEARIAIISVGQRSIFGHPDKGVVERWRATGAEVLTTGERGTITFTTNGRDWNLSTFGER